MTTHEQATKEVADRAIANDPSGELLRGLWAYKTAMEQQEYGGLGNAIGQFWDRHAVTLYDAYAYAVVQYRIHSGELFGLAINVGREPFSDASEELNRAVLANLSIPFSAECFGGGTQHEDGSLMWSAPIPVAQVPCADCNRPLVQCLRQLLPPGRAPLEVGTTLPSRSVAHFGSSGMLARWPYGSKVIYLMVCPQMSVMNALDLSLPRTPKSTKTTSNPRSTTMKKPIPSITVQGKQIIVAGCNWRPTEAEQKTMEALGAVSFSAATTEVPGGFVFKSSQAAKKAFGKAFTEPETYSLDSLPDATRWYDPVGMGALAESVVNGK